MFTLKLYRNGPLAPEGKTIIIETIGLWVSECGDGMKRIQPFTKKVGVMDEDGGYEFYVGGKRTDEMSAVTSDNHYDWGVLENAQGKTTEMFRQLNRALAVSVSAHKSQGPLVTHLAKMLTAYQQKHDVEGKVLAREIGIHESSLTRIKQGKMPDADGLAKIISWLVK